MGRAVLGLIQASHPVPAVAVTVFATAYAVAVQNGLIMDAFGPALPVGAAVFAGQLCVGWSNDALDADRDLAAQREEKPISAGRVGAGTVAAAACLAAAAAVVLSTRLEDDAGLYHLIAVLGAVGYNAGLKSTRLSPVPYLLSFGLVPVIASLAVTGEWPATSTVGAAALLGAGAHFANTVGDTEADALTGVRGLPQRIGPTRSLTVMAVLIALGAAWLLTGVAATDGIGFFRTILAVVLLVAGALLGLVGAVGRVGVPGGGRGRRRLGRPGGPVAFRLTLVAVALVVAGVLLTA
ncbi:UbiA family prenyltransferase [Kineosporia sp. J2-2]|uniref:UbiA family prenyltransferase n=1 Tax=Kineosporia corallincola TaxID=2835133 RepID=A0ABS5TIE2_9ACTN|nr:UbiA family prenyltransferase [Kineosporia corallincola]MBT0769344.1 UbiA family prenyltransferase [Kineosporia corallincola]